MTSMTSPSRLLFCDAFPGLSLVFYQLFVSGGFPSALQEVQNALLTLSVLNLPLFPLMKSFVVSE